MGSSGRTIIILGIILILLVVFGITVAVGMNVFDFVPGGKPNAIITSPPSGSTFHEGEDVAVQSVSTDAKGVVYVQLIVDGQIVRTDAAPAPQDQFTLVQTWKATSGTHTVMVKAFNGANAGSDPAAISIQVVTGAGPATAPTSVASAPTPIPAPTSTTAPGGPSPTTAPSPCTNNSTFVADITVPDGTVVPAGTTVIKTWRLSNNGTCAWGSGYQFVFVSGEAMTAETVKPVPTTAPGATADLSVSITAPVGPGSHTGSWRIRSSTGALFGQTSSVKITVPGAVAPTNTPTPTLAAGCSGAPTIAFFNVDSVSISAGSSTTLRWGPVTNADSVEIDQGIGGIGAGPTGGSQIVSPGATTIYTMTARCGSTPATRQVTIIVNPALSVTRCGINGEGGVVVKSGGSRVPYPGMLGINVGDDSGNNSFRAFWSFDINDLSGKTIDSANLTISDASLTGNPFSNLGTLIVETVDYATIDASAYDTIGSAILSIGSGPNGNYNIKTPLQSAVSASKSRFRMRLRYSTESNADSSTNSVSWTGYTHLCLAMAYH